MRTVTLPTDPKLARIATALSETFGARLVSALLFGSRARGDQRPDSDYDVAVFLADHDVTKDGQVLDDLGPAITGQEQQRVQLMAFGKESLARRTTLMFNIRNQGAPLPGFSWPEVASPSISPETIRPTPEAVALMNRAEVLIKDAQKISEIDIQGSAAREAYRAVLLAARALIFEEMTLAPHTHGGTEQLFIDIAIRSGRIDRGHTATLAEGFKIQIDHDYEVTPSVSDERAIAYVAQAAALTAAIKALLN